jgi:hypothetical protein
MHERLKAEGLGEMQGLGAREMQGNKGAKLHP